MAATTIPTLPSGDFDRTAGFYKPLGFTEDARYPGEYLIMSHRKGIELHFWHKPSVDPKSNDAGCYVRFPTADDAGRLHEQWSETGLDLDQLRPLEDPGYNLLEFALLDPDRNLLRIGGVIQSSNKASSQ